VPADQNEPLPESGLSRACRPQTSRAAGKICRIPLFYG
jgi:hypothetical protein